MRPRPAQNPSSTTRRIATLPLGKAYTPLASQNPSSTTRRIATWHGAPRRGCPAASEPIVHYKKDCDSTRGCPRVGAQCSEPIVHYKKDCDAYKTFRRSALAASEPIVHYKKDCDSYRGKGNIIRTPQNPSSTTRRIATLAPVIGRLLQSLLRTHRPLQEGLRHLQGDPKIFTFMLRTHRPLQEGLRRVERSGLGPEVVASEPIVHYKKDCDRNISSHVGRGSETQNPSSTTRRIATIYRQYIGNTLFAQNPSSTTRRIATQTWSPSGGWYRHGSEPIVHYKKDCDSGVLKRQGNPRVSEPIVHYKKDCDATWPM